MRNHLEYFPVTSSVKDLEYVFIIFVFVSDSPFTKRTSAYTCNSVVGDACSPDVDEHVGVGAVAHGERHVLVVAAVVVLDGLLLRAARHHVVVELAPLQTIKFSYNALRLI